MEDSTQAQPQPAVSVPWNGHLGWLLLSAGFACAIGLDPWSLSERDPAALLASPRLAVRHAQGVGIGMGLLHLLIAQLLMTTPFRPGVRRLATWVTGTGALVYTLGYALLAAGAAPAWLVPTGAALNLAGLLVLLHAALRTRRDPGLTLILAVLSAGMVLDVVNGVFASRPDAWLPSYLGAEDGLRLRMLRLARAASVALSVLALLSRGLAERAPDHPAARWSRRGLLAGMAGMPAVLTAAAFTSTACKYLLPLPATAVFSGTLAAAWLARRHATRLEAAGWLLIAGSMAVGLLVGTFAFDGPLPSPLGDYNAFARRVARLDHAYSVVLGMTFLFAGRWQAVHAPGPGFARYGIPTLVAGAALTIAGLLVAGVVSVPPAALGVGPALVVAGLVACHLHRGAVVAP